MTASNGPGAAAPAPGDHARAVAAARDWARIAGASEDAAVGAAVDAAYALAERFTGQVLIAREMVVVRAASAFWTTLGVAPVRAITAVHGLPADGAAFPLAVGAHAVTIDADGEGRVRVVQPGAAGRIAVTLVAGIADDWERLPPPIAQGIVHLAADRLMARDRDLPPPAAVAALWRPYRRMRLMGGGRCAE